MTKTLVLVRHAHRDTARRELDNGLSEKGRGQARWVKRFFDQRFKDLDSGLWLVSSPKVRCLETLSPIAKSLGRPLDSHPLLDEQGAKEPFERFEERIHLFLHEWTRSSAPLTLLCSHGDWLPTAVFHLLGVQQDFKKGGWLELEWVNGGAALRWYVPSFKWFY